MKLIKTILKRRKNKPSLEERVKLAEAEARKIKREEALKRRLKRAEEIKKRSSKMYKVSQAILGIASELNKEPARRRVVKRRAKRRVVKRRAKRRTRNPFDLSWSIE